MLGTRNTDPPSHPPFVHLQGISSLATGIGPLLFAALFSAVTRSDSPLPYMPQLVWFVAAGLTALAVMLTLSLHR